MNDNDFLNGLNDFESARNSQSTTRKNTGYQSHDDFLQGLNSFEASRKPPAEPFYAPDGRLDFGSTLRGYQTPEEQPTQAIPIDQPQQPLSLKQEFIDKPLRSLKAGAGEFASMLAFPIASAVDAYNGDDINKEALRQSIEDFSRQRRAAAPDPRIGFVGHLARGVEELAPAILAGPAGLATLAGTATTSKAVDLLDEGVDAKTAGALGALSGGTVAAMSAIPLRGSNLLKSIGKGIGVNAAIGAGGRAIDKGVLNLTGYDQQADQIKVLDPTAAAHDIAMGALFGLHQGWGRNKMPEPGLIPKGSVRDAYAETLGNYDAMRARGYSEAELARMSTDFFQEALRRRMSTEGSPTDMTTGEPIEMPGSRPAPESAIDLGAETFASRPESEVNRAASSILDAMLQQKERSIPVSPESISAPEPVREAPVEAKPSPPPTPESDVAMAKEVAAKAIDEQLAEKREVAQTSPDPKERQNAAKDILKLTMEKSKLDKMPPFALDEASRQGKELVPAGQGTQTEPPIPQPPPASEQSLKTYDVSDQDGNVVTVQARDENHAFDVAEKQQPGFSAESLTEVETKGGDTHGQMQGRGPEEVAPVDQAPAEQSAGAAGIPSHIVNAVAAPREVMTAVSQATKQQTKDTLNTSLKDGLIAPTSPIRLTTVEELHDIISTGTLREGKDFEGRSGISAQMVDGKKPIVAYGPNNKISAAIVFPEDSAVGKGQQPNEVKVNAKTDVKSLRFVIDGFKELMTFDQIKAAAQGKNNHEQIVQETTIPEEQTVRQDLPQSRELPVVAEKPDVQTPEGVGVGGEQVAGEISDLQPGKTVEVTKAEKPQWYINADDRPVLTTKDDAIGYRGPYSQLEVSELTGTDKSYLKTAKQGEPVYTPDHSAPVAADNTPIKKLSDWVIGRIEKRESFNYVHLVQAGSDAYQSKLADGKFTVKDLYDAMELGMNQFIAAHPDKYNPSGDVSISEAKRTIENLKDITKTLATQSVRTDEQQEFQQFSTPPAYAYTAAWLADLGKNDTVLEPSAGIGGLVVFAKVAGVKEVAVNELSPRRAEFLKEMGFDRVFTENAEHLNSILPKDVQPTVIIMNPPFSATAGRKRGERNTMNGAKHIEQALKRLEPGGRLVAIVGEGMADNRPAFNKWWDGIKSQYNVLANVGIDGKGYAKYGTTFDNQILVIDKTGPTANTIITGKVSDISQLPELLQGVRNGRQNIAASETGESAPAQPNGKEVAGTGDQTRSTGRAGTVLPAAGGVGDGSELPGERAGSSGDWGRLAGTAGDTVKVDPGRADGVSDNGRHKGQPEGVLGDENRGSRPEGSDGRQGGGGDHNGDTGVPHDSKSGIINIEKADTGKYDDDLSDSVFENYTPQKLKVQGAKPHPSPLVQSAAMAAVEPPTPTYKPNLPKELIESGRVSMPQIEAVVYAGQSHQEVLPSGKRQGFFVGDGTGVGKGTINAAVILDNWNQGRKKAIWISEKQALIKDAQRDLSWVGLDAPLVNLSKAKQGTPITAKEGVLFATYDTIKTPDKTAQGVAAANTSRISQVADWFGSDFDGVLIFDESHNMANNTALKGARGKKEASQKALASLELADKLPNARVVYVSATGATEVSNLGYADRLGLWGEGTPFADKNNFINEISAGGVAAMELVARDMKAMGKYIARSLSYDGVTYSKLEHPLSQEQTAIYNELAEAWQLVLQNLHEVTSDMPSRAKGNVMGPFWSAHQRFFNQVITSMQAPKVIEQATKDLAEGKSVVMQLVNTDEANQERKRASMQEGESLDDLDLTPREGLIGYIRDSFPVGLWEEQFDEGGNIVRVPVLDAQGKQVEDADKVAKRDALLNRLESIRVPSSPLDMILDAFGPDAVAEVTGRKRRIVTGEDGSKAEQKRGQAAAMADADAFMDGRKRILIFSEAGGTGRSYHASLSGNNQERRMHYLLQAGWRADKAIQGLGRTHRTNEASQPHYYLVTTNLKAQARFVSTIARRLDQLGGLTKGQRETGSQGLFSAKDNLESREALAAFQNFVWNLSGGHYDFSMQDFMDQTGLKLTDNDGNVLKELPPITQFLNRLLSLRTDMMDQVFDAFSDQIDTAVELAAQNGTLDAGIETVKALKTREIDSQTVYTDPKTGAETKYVQLELTQPTFKNSFDDVISNRYKATQFVRNIKSGKVRALADAASKTNNDGSISERVRELSVRGSKITDKDDYTPDKYETITRKEARKAWDQEYNDTPDTHTINEHLITGAVLPIWDRLRGNSRIVRVQTDSGKRMIGRLINGRDLSEVLKNLGATRTLPEMTHEQVLSHILDDNYRFTLANGWGLKRTRAGGEYRVEITGVKPQDFRSLESSVGAFIEQINWQSRIFVPAENVGRLLNSKPVVDMSEPGGGSSTLHSNPFLDPAEIVKNISGLKANLERDLPKLMELGKTIFREGANTVKAFTARMKEYLGEKYDAFKEHMVKAFQFAKSAFTDERGQVGMDIGANDTGRESLSERLFAKLGEMKQKVTDHDAAMAMAETWDWMKIVTRPESRSTAAKDMADAMRVAMGRRNRGREKFVKKISDAARDDNMTLMAKAKDWFMSAGQTAADRVFSKMTEQESVDFMQAMDSGDAAYFARNPKLDAIAKVIDEMFQDKARAIQGLGTGALKELRENYFPHIWERNGDEIKQSLGKKPLEGDKSFTKHRVYDDVTEGILAGHKPVSYNPVDLVFLKMHEMDKYLSLHSALQAAERSTPDVVRLVPAGEEPAQGFKFIDGVGSIEREHMEFRGDDTNLNRGTSNRYRYAAREDVAQVLNNYASPSLYSHKGLGKGFGMYMNLANNLNRFQLGVFSAFHAGFTSFEAVISHNALGIRALADGNYKEAAKYFAETPVAWYLNPKRGAALRKAWMDSGQDGVMSEAAKWLEMAGAKFNSDNRFFPNDTQEMLSHWANGRKVKAALKAPLSIVEQSARPIMEMLVPSQKAGVFYEMADYWMRHNQGASQEEVARSMQQIWNRVDSRLGQVNYERLFSQNWAKNMVQALVRAPGWTGGTLLEVGGGLTDTANTLKSAVKGEGVKLTDRTAYTLSLVMMSAMGNAIMSSLFMGKDEGVNKGISDYMKSWDWRDLFTFRTGNVDEYGDPERFILPSYMKDIYAYGKDTTTTLSHKLHPLLGLVSDVVRNRDYYGVEIRHSDDNVAQQAGQAGKYVAKAFIPFWMRGVQKERERDGSFGALVAPLFGVMPAPRAFNQTSAENLSSELIRGHFQTRARTQEEADKGELKAKLGREMRLHPGEVPAEMKDAMQEGKLSRRELLSIFHKSRNAPLVNQIKSLTMEEALQVWRKASQEERDKIRPAILVKAKRLAHSGAREEFLAIKPELIKAGIMK